MTNQGYGSGGGYSKDRQGQGGYRPQSQGGGGYQQGRADSQRPTESRVEALIPLPTSIRGKAELLTHPGLLLDKYAETMDQVGSEILVAKDGQKRQKEVLDKVVQLSKQKEVQDSWTVFYQRQQKAWQTLNIQLFKMQTLSRLSMHLARSSALENAGICLHHIHGFPIIPGSGLKGMARAWASNEGIDPALIRQVFGPSADEIRKGIPEHAGSIVFYDAIPASWPELTVDIVNSHHSQYYQGKDYPGDWDSPIPVYFLTLQAGAQFEFGLAKAQSDVSDDLLQQVKSWLQSALCWSGAGAKTNAGYGLFKSLVGDDLPVPTFKAVYSTSLELTSPAFFAGAMQDGSDCDLRPASLRGMLRWWWRTMHSGFLTQQEMLELESGIFGSASQGGALQIKLEPISKLAVYPYDKTLLVSKYLPTPDKKTAQGIAYHSFGMNDGGKQRFFISPGSLWKVTLLARSQGALSADTILEQGKLALGLFCHFGAVGAKQRKGWGSFAELTDFSLEICKQKSKELRKKLGKDRAFNPRDSQSASIDTSMMLETLEIPTTWTNPFWALHQMGMAAQDFAKKYKHQREKKALGLPRRIGNPASGNFRSNLERHTSPTQFHVAKNSDGKLILRISFFVASRLPDAQVSKVFLSEYRTFLSESLNAKLGIQERLETLPKPVSHSTVTTVSVLATNMTSGSKTLPKANGKVKAVLLEEKTKKGGWKAKHIDSGLSGPIVNSVNVQGQVGDTVELIVNSVTQQDIAFKWPT